MIAFTQETEFDDTGCLTDGLPVEPDVWIKYAARSGSPDWCKCPRSLADAGVHLRKTPSPVCEVAHLPASPTRAERHVSLAVSWSIIMRVMFAPEPI